MPDTDGAALQSVEHPLDAELVRRVQTAIGCTLEQAVQVIRIVYYRIDEINDIAFPADAIETIEIEIKR